MDPSSHVTEFGPDRILIKEEVWYRLPLEPLGDLEHFIIRRELDRVFDHWQATVAELLTEALEN